MPTQFKHVVNTEIGTVPVDILQIPAGVRATVIGCNLANVTDAETIFVNVYVVDEFSTQAHYIKELVIPPNSSVKLITNGEKLILPPNAGLRVVSDTASSVDSVVSYVEIS